MTSKLAPYDADANLRTIRAGFSAEGGRGPVRRDHPDHGRLPGGTSLHLCAAGLAEITGGRGSLYSGVSPGPCAS